MPKRPFAPVQLPLPVPEPEKRGWGGARPGAGRKPKSGGRPNMPHGRRPEHAARCPVHVTFRARKGLPSFRSQVVKKRLKDMLARQLQRDYGPSFQVGLFTIQDDHLHLVVEAKAATPEQIAASPRLLSKNAARGRESKDRDRLRRGIAGIAVAFARGLNRLLGRKGAVWADRHHRRELTTPSEVRSAMVYVLQNYRRHGAQVFGTGACDPFSSAVGFRGWAEPHATWDETEPWSPRPRTWLLGTGWQRAGGLISTLEAPPLSPFAEVGSYEPYARILFDGIHAVRVPVQPARERAAARPRLRPRRAR